MAHVGPVKRTKHFFNFRREQTLDDDLLSDSTMSESYVSSSASGPYSRQGSAPDAEEEQTGDFSQTLGAALSKFGCAQSSCETTSCGSAQPVEPQGAPRPAAVSLSEVSHDGASSQGWVSVHDASVLAGKTTVMVKNVPVKYTQRKLLREFLSAGFHGKMDFIYLPIDPRSRCSRGFAFCNFSSPEVTQEFFSTFHKKFLNSYDSEVPLEVAAAEIQGFEANAEHYLVVKASRKEKGRDTFGCPTFLKPLPQQFLSHLREEAPEEPRPADRPDRRLRAAAACPAPGLPLPPAMDFPGPAQRVPKVETRQQPMYFEPKATASSLRPLEIPQVSNIINLTMCLCTNCHQTISSNAFCPYCGSVNELATNTYIGKPFWI